MMKCKFGNMLYCHMQNYAFDLFQNCAFCIFTSSFLDIAELCFIVARIPAASSSQAGLYVNSKPSTLDAAGSKHST